MSWPVPESYFDCLVTGLYPLHNNQEKKYKKVR